MAERHGDYPWSRARTRLMSETPAGLAQAMRTAFGEAVSEEPGALVVTEGGVRLRFALHPGAPRRIALLELPTLRVEISVLAGDEAAARRLLARIDRATQRGGG